MFVGRNTTDTRSQHDFYGNLLPSNGLLMCERKEFDSVRTQDYLHEFTGRRLKKIRAADGD